MTCTTHHDACQCREAEHAAEIAQLTAEVEGLREDTERLIFACTHLSLIDWYNLYYAKLPPDSIDAIRKTVDAARGKP